MKKKILLPAYLGLIISFGIAIILLLVRFMQGNLGKPFNLLSNYHSVLPKSLITGFRVYLGYNGQLLERIFPSNGIFQYFLFVISTLSAFTLIGFLVGIILGLVYSIICILTGIRGKQKLSSMNFECKSFWLILVLLFSINLSTGFLQSRNEGLNIILISIDTLRDDHLGCYGYSRNTTPNIDRLAGKSIIFKNVFAAAPWTLPSHVSIMTSLYPSLHRVSGAKDRIDDTRVTIAEALIRNQYTTAGVISVSWLKSFFGFNRGFQEYIEDYESKATPNPTAESITKKAILLLEELKQSEKFFLFIHYFDVHATYDPPSPYDKIFSPEFSSKKTDISRDDLIQESLRLRSPKETISREDLERIIALYDGEIGYVDSQIGVLLNTLDSMGLLNKTAIILTSDHGEEFKEHGSMSHGASLYDEVLKVPLILYNPKNTKGIKVQEPVSTIDIAPTILSISGSPIEKEFQGIDLMNIVKNNMNNQPHEDRALYSEVNIVENEKVAIKAIRKKNNKLIKSYLKADEIQDAIRKTGNKGEFFPRPLIGEEFYDLNADKSEQKNLVNLKEYMGDYLEMKSQLTDWTKNMDMAASLLPWSAKKETVKLDKKGLNELRSLGYIK
ncbi:MAG: sulfatase [Candidatus Schekmanbacteria bacterium]|nr:sulfatase [Candidatus Schekmanbacteria bacterium]